MSSPGDGGEELVILAERPRRGVVRDEDVRAVLSERTGVVPTSVVWVEPGQLPRTSSGKIKREEAAERYLPPGTS